MTALWIAAAYAAIGLVFGLYFVTAGYRRLNPGAAGAGVGTRLLWLPGSMCLWPLLLAKSLAGTR